MTKNRRLFFKRCALSFIFLFLILNGIFYTVLQYAVESSLEEIKTSIKIDYPDPIDVVYTWVNGSEKSLLSQLNIYKQNLYLDSNFQIDASQHRLSCPFPICAYNGHVLLSPPPPNEVSIEDFLHTVSMKINTLIHASSNNSTNMDLVTTVHQSRITHRSGLILRSSEDISSLFVNRSDLTLRLDSMTMNYTVSQVFIAAEAETGGLPIDGCAFVHGLKEMKDANVEASWMKVIAKATSVNISLVKASSTSFLVIFPPNITFDSFSLAFNESATNHIKVKQAYLIIDTSLATILSDLTESRYQDNEELRYSLRSLDSYLSFYRHIFIVTNGQVPSWLDTDNPKITVVTHSQIFMNASDLPTFNSAAIEANIHNIPGLAAHFIYLNDDVFFGKPIHREDFFSLTSGYKVYLGWSVPDCVERCPNSWLADGFCDHECNVPECQWDAGDCIKTHGKVGSVDFAVAMNQSLAQIQRMAGLQWSPSTLKTCNSGCNHNWLADRYCDSSCNVVQCGFDLGDCGDVNLRSLPSSIISQPSGQLVVIENGTEAYVLDLRPLIGRGDNVTRAVIDDAIEVVATSYAVKYRLLVVLLKSRNSCGDRCFNTTNQILNINFTVYNGSTFKYNITVGLELNTNKTSETYRNIGSTSSSKTLPPRSWPTFQYRTPGSVPFLNNFDNSSVSIDRLEWLKPLEMSHYRLLLQDGLISIAGYHHLIQQLWAASLQQGSHNVQMTALENADIHLEQLSWGFLPWERNWITRLLGTTPPENATSIKFATMRRTLDLYAESLRHSNRLMSGVFGLSQRRVPAHGPHFVNTAVLSRAHDRFHRDWQSTSSHRFRTPFDVQFAFTYFYFLMSERRNVSSFEMVAAVDTDLSGTLDNNELRSLALVLSTNDTLDDTHVDRFLQQVRNQCRHNKTLNDDILVNATDLPSCLNISGSRPDSSVPLYPFITFDDSDLAFLMISASNRDKVRHDLDLLRKRPRKFFCLNDNLPSNSGDPKLIAEIRKDLRDFLRYTFPFPSQFERRHQRRPDVRKAAKVLLAGCVCSLVVSLALAIFVLSKAGRLCRGLWRWGWRLLVPDGDYGDYRSQP